MENSPSLAGMSGLPAVPSNKIPRVIGTQVHFIADGKIYVGLIRKFNSEQELTIQCGSSTNRVIRYNQIISVLANEKDSHCYLLNVSVSIVRNNNRTIIQCQSTNSEVINGIAFFSAETNKEKMQSPISYDWLYNEIMGIIANA